MQQTFEENLCTILEHEWKGNFCKRCKMDRLQIFINHKKLDPKDYDVNEINSWSKTWHLFILKKLSFPSTIDIQHKKVILFSFPIMPGEETNGFTREIDFGFPLILGDDMHLNKLSIGYTSYGEGSKKV